MMFSILLTALTPVFLPVQMLVDTTPGDNGPGSSPLSLFRDANDKIPAEVAEARNNMEVRPLEEPFFFLRSSLLKMCPICGQSSV